MKKTISRISIIIIFIYCIALNAQTYDNISTGEINKRVILIGDAGDPSTKGKEPVLSALYEIAREVKDSTVVIFLGDNIYPNGLPDAAHPKRKFYERQIKQQIETIVNSGATGFFIPGNHDWNRGEEDGLEFIKRQSQFVNKFSDQKIYFLPEQGCPGPDYFDLGDDLRIIFMDSQWWLQDKDSRSDKTDSCKNNSEQKIIEELLVLINEPDKFIIIASHHPLITYGKHGGRFSTMFHIFPLLELNPKLYIPLPIIGSLRPLARNLGISKQDISNLVYWNMIRKIESVISRRQGIIYASGHDHALQLLRGVNDNLYVVSGAGIYDQVDDFVDIDKETLFAEAAPGFFVIDFLSDGRISISALKVTDRRGTTEVRFRLTTK